MAKFTANDIRRLAEAVDGDRKGPVKIVIRNGKLHRLHKGEQPQNGDETKFELEFETKNQSKNPGKFNSIVVDPPIKNPTKGNAPIADIFEVFDAMFWSEPAVEKFVLPYYLRYMSPKDVGDLWNDFLGIGPNSRDDEQVLAFGHLPYSEPSVVTPDDDGREAIVVLVRKRDAKGDTVIELRSATAHLNAMRRR